jgi:hypothetical protein
VSTVIPSSSSRHQRTLVSASRSKPWLGSCFGRSTSTCVGRKGSGASPSAAAIAKPTRQSTPASSSRLPIPSAAAIPIVIQAPKTPSIRTPPAARA